MDSGADGTTPSRRITGGVRRGRRARVALSLVVTVLIATVLTGGPATAGSGWQAEGVPTHGRSSATLLAVDCAGTDSCVAVGSTVDTKAARRPLAQVWNGSAWTDVSTVVPGGAVDGRLSGVSCTSSGDCTAVGTTAGAGGVTAPLVETADVADGGDWSLGVATLPEGATAGDLDAVSCVDGTCVATGTYVDGSGATDALAETSTGGAFEPASVPAPDTAASSRLEAVSCSSAQDCVAVGSSTKAINGGTASGAVHPLVESWDGSTWTRQATPTPAGGNAPVDVLAGVSCPSSTSCLAVGTRTNKDAQDLPLAEAYNGTKWSLVTPAVPADTVTSGLDAVSCLSGTCSVVGGSQDSTGVTHTLAESWDGTTWSIVSTPTAGVLSSLLVGVACPAGECFAVGSESTATARSTALAEVDAGSKWSVQTTPDPTGDPLNALGAVSCLSASSCTAVGQGRTADGVDLPLVEVGGDGGLTVQTVPAPTDVSSAGLVGVSCPVAGDCEAVGAASGSTTTPLAEGYDGTSWTIQTIPLPDGALGGSLMSVSCPVAGTCLAVGWYDNSSGVAKGLAEELTDGSWEVQATPASSGVTVDLAGVSCSTTEACSAVGTSTGTSGTPAPVAESWDGSTWELESTPPVPSGALGGGLAGIDCSAASACVAVGQSSSYTESAHPAVVQAPLGERWDGSTWSRISARTPSSATSAALASVACSDSVCTAVGTYVNHADVDQALAESLPGGTSGGGTFATETIPRPAGTSSASIAGVSCVGASTCTSVGSIGSGVPTSSQALVEAE